MSLAEDAALARAIADEAGALLLALRARLPGDCGAAGDAQANALILERLAAARPDDCVLSEEAADDSARCTRRRVWIVDPLDGTREFGEGREDWAVHVGLAIDGRPAVGAVAVPARGGLWDSATVPPSPPRETRRPRIVVSRSRSPPSAPALAAALAADLDYVGSAGVKAMLVVEGAADAYLHVGGQHEWDNCAPVAIALAAGLHVSALDGAPLVYNQFRPTTPDFLICRRELAGRALAALATTEN